MPDKRQRIKSKYTADRHMPGAFEGETVTRRRFMTGTVHSAGAIAAASFGLPALGFAVGVVGKSTPHHWEDVGAVADFPDNTYVPVSFTLVPGVGESGKSTAYMRKRNSAIDQDKPDEFNKFIAITTRCAHLGCPVRYTSAAQRFICPCHGGVYDLLGKRVGGPPVRPLDRFYTRLAGDRVQIGPRYSVNSELKRFSPRDPGEPIDGIGQYLYPSRPSSRKL